MKSVLIFSMTFCCWILIGQNPLELPLFNIQDLEYQGGYRLPANDYGVSDLNYSQGPIEFNASNNSLFIVGHSHQQAIAEFALPEIVNSTILQDLNMASDPIQAFSAVLDRANSGNSQGIDRIGGLKLINGSLLVNGYEYYDANGDVTHSTLKVMDGSDIAGSEIQGYYSFEGGAGLTSGWISPLPQEWAEYLDAEFITGQSSGIPIISRTSVGPTAYTFKAQDFGVGEMVPTTQYLDFSYPNGINEDLDNSEGENDVWTHLSRVVYGFVVPGTRTYLTLGHSGGHESGVCYKCTQDDGNLCGGYCTPVASDNYQHYWLWDMADLMDVKNGARLPHEVQPYDYGQFNTPFQIGFNELGGGSYDPASNRLFLSVKRADRDQGTYANPPVIVVYEPQVGQALPVDWIGFRAEEYERFVLLSWEVENEVGHEFYEVESFVENKWVSLGRVYDGYEFIDRNPQDGWNTYRIKQVDFNGRYTYSPIRKILMTSRDKILFHPNPFYDMVKIDKEEKDLVRIFTTEGRLLVETYEPIIDLKDLSSGIYIGVVGGVYQKIVKE